MIFIVLGILVNDSRGRLKACWKAVFDLANDESYSVLRLQPRETQS